MLSNCSALHINFKYRFSRDSALNAVHFQVLSLIFIFILCMSRYLFQFLDIVSINYFASEQLFPGITKYNYKKIKKKKKRVQFVCATCLCESPDEPVTCTILKMPSCPETTNISNETTLPCNR